MHPHNLQAEDQMAECEGPDPNVCRSHQPEFRVRLDQRGQLGPDQEGGNRFGQGSTHVILIALMIT